MIPTNKKENFSCKQIFYITDTQLKAYSNGIITIKIPAGAIMISEKFLRTLHSEIKQYKKL